LRHRATEITSPGYELLETVCFKVDVEPIKGKLKKYKYGTSLPIEQPIPPKHKPSFVRTRNMRNGKKDQPTRACSTRPEGSHDTLRRSRTASPSENDANPDGEQDLAPYYYWVDFLMEVEFKDSLMSYHLTIKDTDKSYKGEVNLISIVKPFDPHEDEAW
jgi:hypothetical protein